MIKRWMKYQALIPGNYPKLPDGYSWEMKPPVIERYYSAPYELVLHTPDGEDLQVRMRRNKYTDVVKPEHLTWPLIKAGIYKLLDDQITLQNIKKDRDLRTKRGNSYMIGETNG